MIQFGNLCIRVEVQTLGTEMIIYSIQSWECTWVEIGDSQCLSPGQRKPTKESISITFFCVKNHSKTQWLKTIMVSN